MGFAADFGRADVPGTIQRGLAPLRETQAIQAAGQVNELNAIKLQEAKDKQEYRNRHVDFMNHPIVRGMPDVVRKKFVDDFGRDNLVGPSWQVQQKFFETLKVKPELIKQYRDETTFIVDEDIRKLDEQIYTATANGEPAAKIQKLTSMRDLKNKSRSDISKSLTLLDEKLRRDKDLATHKGGIDANTAAVKAGKPSASERNITTFMEQYGIDRGTATKLEHGLITVGTDPLGNPALIDKVSSQVIPVQAGQSAQPEPPATGTQEAPVQPGSVPPPATAPPFAVTPDVARGGTGPMASLKEKFNNLFGAMTQGIPFAETADNRQSLRLFKQQVKIGLVNNSRFPVYEQKLMDGLVPDVNKFFRDPDEAAQKLGQLKGFLETKKQTRQAALDSGNISAKQTKEYSGQINDIDGILSMMTSIESNGLPDVTTMSDEELDRIISGSE